MADGIIPGIIGIVRGIHDRQQAAKFRDALAGDGDPAHNYLNDPQAVIQHVMAFDPEKGIAMSQDQTAQQRATQKYNSEKAASEVKMFGGFLRGLPPGSDYGKAIDDMSPYLTGELGMDPKGVSAFRDMVSKNPDVIQGLDDKAYELLAKDRFSNTVAAPGDHVIRGGKVIDSVPFAPKTVTTQAGASTNVFDPNTGQFVTEPTSAPAAAPASGAPASSSLALTVDALRPHFLAQESHGDYTETNKDTGALGAYQVMPETGRAIAQRLGLAWRPDMMHKDDPASKRYQDAIGGAAIGDSIAAGNGSPEAIFSHYYSGSPTAYTNAKGNPKTAAYVRGMMGRIGGSAAPAGAGGGAPAVTATSVVVPPKPTKAATTTTTLTPEEAKAAGYPEGAVVQRDSSGKETVTYKPGKAPDHEAALSSYNEAKASINDIRDNLIKLRDDPDLTTGGWQYVMQHVPGTHARYLAGLASQINSQKLVGLATALKQTGGNPFQRITNMEAQQLPKTLGNFDLTQNSADLKKNINDALKQLDGLEGRLDAGAKRTGLLNGDEGGASSANSIPVGATATNPKTGERVRFNGKTWEPLHG